MGKAKATVLPVPVWARPSTSRPNRAGGMASAWIGRGAVNDASETAWSSSGRRSKWSKPALERLPEVCTEMSDLSAASLRVARTDAHDRYPYNSGGNDRGCCGAIPCGTLLCAGGREWRPRKVKRVPPFLSVEAWLL